MSFSRKNASTEQKAIFFIALTFIFSTIFYYLVAVIENNGWLYFGLMWCPGVAALVSSLYFQGSLKGFGWGPGKAWYLPFSFLVPILELSLVYGIIWQFSLGGFAGFENNFITRLAPLAMVLMILEGCYFAGRSALGEEIGWRGYLTPLLLEKFSPNTVSLVIGAVWAVWHFPIMISGDYGAATPLLYQLLCFTLMIMGVNFVYTWFRIKSDSFWTGVLLHTSGNLFIFHVFDDLTTDTGNTAYFIGETGAVYAAYSVLLMLSFLIWGWDWPGEIWRKICGLPRPEDR